MRHAHRIHRDDLLNADLVPNPGRCLDPRLEMSPEQDF